MKNLIFSCLINTFWEILVSLCVNMIFVQLYFTLQEVLLLEEDVKALEEMYPQGEKVKKCALIVGQLKAYFFLPAKVSLQCKQI